MDATDTSSGDSSTQQHDDGGGTATEAAPQLDENTVEAEDDDGTATELQRLRAAASSPLLDLPTRETIRMVDKPKRRGATRGVAALKAARQGSDDTGTPAVASASDTVDMDLIQRRCEESVRRAAQHTALMKEMRAKRKAQRKATQGRRRWSLVRKAALVAMAMSRVGKDVVEGSADIEHFPKYNDFKRNISIPPEARNERSCREMALIAGSIKWFQCYRFTLEQRMAMAGQWTLLTFRDAGEIVFRSGDEGDAFYVILIGCVRVYNIPEGHFKPKEVARLQTGDGFGELALIRGQQRWATIETVTPTQLLRIPKASYLTTVRPVQERVIAEKVAFLRRVACTKELPEVELKRLAAVMTVRTFGVGHTLTIEGEPVDPVRYFLVVKTGEVRVEKRIFPPPPTRAASRDSRSSSAKAAAAAANNLRASVTVAVVGPGDVPTPLEEVRQETQAASADLLRAATLVTNTICEIAIITKYDFLNRLSTDSQRRVRKHLLDVPSYESMQQLHSSNAQWQAYKQTLMSEVISQQRALKASANGALWLNRGRGAASSAHSNQVARLAQGRARAFATSKDGGHVGSFAAVGAPKRQDKYSKRIIHKAQRERRRSVAVKRMFSRSQLKSVRDMASLDVPVGKLADQALARREIESGVASVGASGPAETLDEVTRHGTPRSSRRSSVSERPQPSIFAWGGGALAGISYSPTSSPMGSPSRAGGSQRGGDSADFMARADKREVPTLGALPEAKPGAGVAGGRRGSATARDRVPTERRSSIIAARQQARGSLTEREGAGGGATHRRASRKQWRDRALPSSNAILNSAWSALTPLRHEPLRFHGALPPEPRPSTPTERAAARVKALNKQRHKWVKGRNKPPGSPIHSNQPPIADSSGGEGDGVDDDAEDDCDGSLLKPMGNNMTGPAQPHTRCFLTGQYGTFEQNRRGGVPAGFLLLKAHGEFEGLAQAERQWKNHRPHRRYTRRRTEGGGGGGGRQRQASGLRSGKSSTKHGHGGGGSSSKTRRRATAPSGRTSRR